MASLKARLSEFLDAVRAGEEVIVTDRGRPVARLVPVGAAGRDDARLSRLIRAGLAKPPVRKLPKDFWTMRRPADPHGRALTALTEERAEGR
ncbi:MAG: type II toxin-antitoxin system prevent-host-death family antitoxin [Armatimonadetes bacterium]|nr:type II toxin-antitoxin system prevent-host-death family antitoxin [Armatimonadota bacterium]